MEPKKKKLTETQLALACGIDYRTLLGYRHRGCTATAPEEVLAWREENVGYGRPTRGERANGAVKSGDDEDLKEENLRKKNRQLDLENEEKELDLAERKRQLLDATDVELKVSELTGMIRARLESIAHELEPEWSPEYRAFVTERLTDKHKLVLTEMSQWRLE